MIVFGDIAGNYLTFQKLLRIIEKKLGKSVPSEEEIVISLGDINDRGPKTKEMIQWFIDNAPHARGILGNHEHMMTEEYCAIKATADMIQDELWLRSVSCDGDGDNTIRHGDHN